MIELVFNDDKINLDKINPTVRDILENVAIPRSRYSYSEDFIIQAIHTSFGHFATSARLSYIPSGGNALSSKMTTYYAISFLSSGKGKDHFTDVIENELFHKLTKGFDALISKKAKDKNSKTKAEMELWLEEGITDENKPYGKKEYNEDIKTRFMATTVDDLGLRFGQATPEGLAYARNRVKMIDTGSPILKIPEFSSALSSPDLKQLFTSLIELWENGNMSPKTTKEKLLPNSSNIPILFYAYTDPSKIINDERKQRALVDEFSSGIGRRTFVVYPDENEFVERKVKFLTEIKEDTKERITKPIMENIKKFFNKERLDTWKKPIQRFSEEAIAYMDIVNDKCSAYEISMRGKLTDGELANITSLGSKIEKLASIYAFIDGRVIISVDDCKYATYWSSYTSKYLGKISKILTQTEKLFYLMKRKQEWISGMEVEQAGIFDKSFDFNKKLESTLQNLSQLCAMNNYELIVSKKDGGTILKVRRIPLVDENKIRTSYMAGEHELIVKRKEGWNPIEFKWNDIHTYLCGNNQSALIACELDDGLRLDDSANGKIQFLSLDFDDGSPTWEEALREFDKYTYFAYTTRNHRKEKNGKVCDRFRIILLLEREMELTKGKYSSMYKRVQQILAPTSDKACSNISRIFFNSPNSEYKYNEGAKFKAHLFCDENKIEKVYSNTTKLDGSGLKNYFLSEIDIVNASRTGGVNALVKACYATRDPMNMSSLGEAEAWIRELANMIYDEYWKRHNLEKEVLGVLRKVW